MKPKKNTLNQANKVGGKSNGDLIKSLKKNTKGGGMKEKTHIFRRREEEAKKKEEKFAGSAKK